jgi:maleate cis-trans isomerase
MALTLEYGARGLVGVLTPQANPTVEPELSMLLGPEIGMLTARLVCTHPDMLTRLLDYFFKLDETLATFGDAPLRVVGFACTGTSYLLDPEEEAAKLAGQKVPVITAAAAVERALDELGARKIAIVSPYAAWLTEACVAHWRRRGREVLAVTAPETPGGFHSIYTTRGRTILDAVRAAEASRPEAIILAGTGLPTLSAVAAHRGPPALSSNLCLAWSMEAALGNRATLAEWLAPDAPWREVLAARFPAARQLS